MSKNPSINRLTAAEIEAKQNMCPNSNIGNAVAEPRPDTDRRSQRPTSVIRQWGYYTVVADGTRWRTKILVVDPGKSTSIQRHLHRMEWMTVVEGTLQADLIDDTVLTVFEGGTALIDKGTWHQLTNPGKLPLVIVETWLGEYLDEDDIERKAISR